MEEEAAAAGPAAPRRVSLAGSGRGGRRCVRSRPLVRAGARRGRSRGSALALSSLPRRLGRPARAGATRPRPNFLTFRPSLELCGARGLSTGGGRRLPLHACVQIGPGPWGGSGAPGVRAWYPAPTSGGLLGALFCSVGAHWRPCHGLVYLRSRAWWWFGVGIRGSCDSAK